MITQTNACTGNGAGSQKRDPERTKHRTQQLPDKNAQTLSTQRVEETTLREANSK
jgi:hypothetical protein